MGNIRLGIPEETARELRDRFSIELLVETGTYKAGTTRWAAANFKNVISIESHEPYFVRAKGIGLPENVALYYGDSRAVLPGVLRKLHQPILFWLDAHWCGSYEKSVGTDGECPLREELEAIKAHPHYSEHVILIDDARLFTSPPQQPHDATQWMTYDEIAALLNDKEITIRDDVIFAIPKR